MNKGELRDYIRKNSPKYFPALYVIQKHELLKLANTVSK